MVTLLFFHVSSFIAQLPTKLPLLLILLECVSSKPINEDFDDASFPLAVAFGLIGLATCLLLFLFFRACWALVSHLTSDPAQNFEGWSEEAIQSYDLARAFEQNYPPNSIPTDITPEQRQLIQEKGVYAWTFVTEHELNVFVNDRTELSFLGGETCIQTNLPIPKQQPIYYFEIKMFEKPVSTNVGIGVATKPYPSWRFPGFNKTSIGYLSETGKKHHNNPFSGIDFGSPYNEGDVIGCGYRPRSGTVFFTKNGVKIGDAYSGLKCNLFPTVASDGPCVLHVNLGQMGFVFIEANVGKWGLAPCEGSLLPPPAYGLERDSILLETGLVSQSTSQLTPQILNKPPSYMRNQKADKTVPSTLVSASSPPPSYLEGSSERAPLLGDYDSEL